MILKQISPKQIVRLNGVLEILQCLSNKEVKSFSVIKRLKNSNTNKAFSANTIALRLKELEEEDFIERKMFKNGNRWVVGYAISDKGIKLLRLYNQFNEELKGINE